MCFEAGSVLGSTHAVDGLSRALQTTQHACAVSVQQWHSSRSEAAGHLLLLADIKHSILKALVSSARGQGRMPYNSQQVALTSQCNSWSVQHHHKCLKPCMQQTTMMLPISVSQAL